MIYNSVMGKGGEVMRLKNVKGAKEIIDASPYIIKNPWEFKGRYDEIFGNGNKICLEIGMGKGDFIINMALKNKDINYIGIEMFDSVIVRAIQKLEGLDIPNLRLIRFDATNIEDIMERDIDTLYLNFSDPWPKNRNEKRRLTSERFLNRYDSIFKKDKHIIQKTDNRKLFEFSLISYVNHGYLIKDISLDLHGDDYDNIVTEYEKRFSEFGFKIYMVEVIKVDKTLHVK